MTRQQIEHSIRNPHLDSHTRENLLQLLHYMTVEGVDISMDTAEPTNKQHKRSHGPAKNQPRR